MLEFIIVNQFHPKWSSNSYVILIIFFLVICSIANVLFMDITLVPWKQRIRCCISIWHYFKSPHKWSLKLYNIVTFQMTFDSPPSIWASPDSGVQCLLTQDFLLKGGTTSVSKQGLISSVATILYAASPSPLSWKQGYVYKPFKSVAVFVYLSDHLKWRLFQCPKEGPQVQK